MFGNLGWTELVLLFLLFLLLFGARRLPEIGQSLGRGIREFKKSIGGSGGEDEEKEPKTASGSEIPPPRDESRL
ncbi:MAG: twin-arginine translocase TatA/TatE family subunit [Gemmatimonadota bacterium]